MKRIKLIIVSLTLCSLFLICSPLMANHNLDEEDVNDVAISLTEFKVTDTDLELKYTIKNNTDHDVWICDTLRLASSTGYEHFLSSDNRTLVIRRRFTLPKIEGMIYEFPPLTSRYVRLCPGQEKYESISLTVPVPQQQILAGEMGNAEYAECIALEIGFYNEDLSSLILRIVEIAKIINCGPIVGFPDPNDQKIIARFFGGWQIANLFEHLLGFSVHEGDNEIFIPYLGQILNGEQVLHMMVNSVSIKIKPINVISG